MPNQRKAFPLAVLAALGALWGAACPRQNPPPPAAVDAGPLGDVEVQILGTNDFHGALDPTTGQNGGALGGAALLAAMMSAVRTTTSITVSAGDNIGASPIDSGLFHDEPAIDVMNAMGLELSAVGNHEFDKGIPELQRIQNGGCHPVDGCVFEPTFDGAAFHYLAANVVDRASGELLFPPYEIRVFEGIPIAFVGLSTVHTAATTVAAAVADIDFLDEADAVNALVPSLHDQGVDTIVVMVHAGGGQNTPSPDLNGCVSFSDGGLAARMDPAVKLVMEGHVHAVYNCIVDGKVVTQVGKQGVALTDARLQFHDGKFVGVTATNLAVSDGLEPDPAVAAIVASADAAAAPLADRVIGTITADIVRAPSLSTGESPLGDVIADGMLHATEAPPAEAQVAMMNFGGIRADLSFAKSGAESADGQVRYAEAFAVQPFQNALVTVSITGADLFAILDAVESHTGPAVEFAGLSFVVDSTASPVVDPATVLVQGVPVQSTDIIRVTTNNILADPVSGFASLADGADQVGGGVDLDALVAYFALGPVSPPAARISTP